MSAPENLPWVTVGVDLFDVLVEQMAATPGPLDVTLFCNVLSVKDARRLREALDTGRFRSLRLVVDRGAFVLRQGADDGQVHNAGDVEAILGAERIRGICTHLKAVVWQGDAGGGCLISSANLNHNNRPECHDRADHMAGPLLAIADELFAEIPPGVTPPSSHAYRGIGLALDQVRDGWEGVEGVDAPPDATQGGIYLTTRVGMADVLPGLLAAAGRNPRIWASTWSLKPDHVTALCGWRDDGVDVRLWVPSRFAVRRQNVKFLGQVANLADEITWSPVHGKIVVVSGDRASYLLTGCANLGRVTNLDCFRVRVGGFELAEHGCALLEALPTEPAPELPPPAPLTPPRNKRGPLMGSTAGPQDGSHPESLKVEAIRRVLVLGQMQAQVAQDLKVSVASIRNWSGVDRLVRMARELGSAPPHPQPPPEDPPPDWTLEPVDADPLAPGPITRRILAAAYRLTTRLDTLDDLVRWPRGTVGLWFEDAEGDGEGDAFGALRAHLDAAAACPSVELVRDLRRARALADLELIERALECGKGAFMAMALLKARRPAEYDPEQRSSDEAEDPLGDYSDADLDAIIEAGRR